MSYQKEKIQSYYQGMREGIILYAHWSDGVQYVGTTGLTLSLALARINQEEQTALGNINEPHA